MFPPNLKVVTLKCRIFENYVEYMDKLQKVKIILNSLPEATILNILEYSFLYVVHIYVIFIT